MRADKITFSYGIEKIYDEASFYLNEKEKTGIVGVNGAGKTTLFHILLKNLELDSGKITWDEKKKIGYLPQEIIYNQEDTVLDYLLESRPIKKLEEEQIKIYEKIAENPANKKNYKELEKVENLLNYYEQYQAENILFEMIENMKIDINILDMKMKELSGGQKSKIAFLNLLYSKKDVLLLDEPTNHLDKDTRKYIIDYLKNYKGMILVISHDIDFLNNIVDNILFLDKTTHQTKVYKGNYTSFLKQKEEEIKQKEKAIEKQEQQKEKLKTLVLKYSNSSGKRKKMAESREKMLERLEKNSIEKDLIYKTVKLKIKPEREISKIPIKVNNISFAYTQDKKIINNLSFTIAKNERFLIVGENGVGKSTLLKLLIGNLKAQEGNIWYGNKTDIAYYAQEQEDLDLEKTILENVDTKGYSEKELRTLLGNFLFFKDDVFKKVKVLSPGEKARVSLAKVLLKKANLLLLDEPTNHLDPQTQKIIGENFRNYEGTIIMVSHNPSFIESIGIDRMLILPKGKITNYSKEKLLENSTRKSL